MHAKFESLLSNELLGQGITFKERDRAAHLTAPLKNNKGR
jgi:hypothetical protein